MRKRISVFKDASPIEVLLLRDRLGFDRYRKQRKRNPEERKILIDLGLQKIDREERENYIVLDYRKRRVKI
jgi:hypothetical protein